MKVIKVEDSKGIGKPIYEVIFMGRMIYASEDEEECWEYIEKWGFLYYNLLLG